MFAIKSIQRAVPGVLLITLVAGFAHIARSADGPRAPTRLRCEYLADPLGIDVTAPRLNWVLDHDRRGEKQTAYQVLVSGRLQSLNDNQGDQWDSGQLNSGDSTQIVYSGKPVESGHTYYWKVRYWDNEKRASDYSAPARFEMGLLSRQEWKGKWITGNRLRREFHLEGKVAPVFTLPLLVIMNCVLMGRKPVTGCWTLPGPLIPSGFFTPLTTLPALSPRARTRWG